MHRGKQIQCTTDSVTYGNSDIDPAGVTQYVHTNTVTYGNSDTDPSRCDSVNTHDSVTYRNSDTASPQQL